MITLKYTDKQNLPGGFNHVFNTDLRAYDLRPKVEKTSTTWNGDSEDVQVEKWARVEVNFPTTESEANKLYDLQNSIHDLYLDKEDGRGFVQYELEEVSEREVIGRSEFRKMTVTLHEKESQITNFFSSSFDDNLNYRLILNNLNVTVSGYTQTYYTKLMPLEMTENLEERENWNKQSIVKFSQVNELAKLRLYLTESQKNDLQSYIYKVDETHIVETGNYVTRTGTIDIDASGNLTGYSDADFKLLTEGVKIRANSTIYTITSKMNSGIVVSPTTAITGETWESEKTYAKININDYSEDQAANDLYEIDVTISTSETVTIVEGNYDLYIYNSNTSNVPNGWAAARDGDDQLVYNSILQPLEDYQDEAETSDRTGRTLVENVRFDDLLIWKTYTDDQQKAKYLQKYIRHCDFIRLVNIGEYETQAGTIDISTGGAVTVDSGASFENLRPGMKIKESTNEYTITAKTSDTEMTVTPSPSIAVSASTWQAEEQHEIQKNTSEVIKNKTDVGIYELELKMILVSSEKIHYPYKN